MVPSEGLEVILALCEAELLKPVRLESKILTHPGEICLFLAAGVIQRLAKTRRSIPRKILDLGFVVVESDRFESSTRVWGASDALDVCRPGRTRW